MGRRGPAPTPTAKLKIRGSWRAFANRKEPVAPEGAPPRPTWLSAEACAVWTDAVAQLCRMKVVTEADGNALARYADAFVRWRKVSEFLAANGDVYTLKGDDGKTVKCVMPWPQVAIYNQLGATLIKLEQEFGLTPASRSRIQVAGDDGQKDKAPTGKMRFFAG